MVVSYRLSVVTVVPIRLQFDIECLRCSNKKYVKRIFVPFCTCNIVVTLVLKRRFFTLVLVIASGHIYVFHSIKPS